MHNCNCCRTVNLMLKHEAVMTDTWRKIMALCQISRWPYIPLHVWWLRTSVFQIYNFQPSDRIPSIKFITCSRAVRYEDLSVEPHKGVQELFQFFGLDFHPNIQLFLDTHTKVNVGGVSSTYRNSKSAPFRWRQKLEHSEVRAIQRACAPAMHYWGYRRAANSSHQKDFDPLGEFSLS